MSINKCLQYGTRYAMDYFVPFFKLKAQWDLYINSYIFDNVIVLKTGQIMICDIVKVSWIADSQVFYL